MMGLVGWSVVVPALVGTGLGLWLDGKLSGRISWTLTLMLVGLVVGCGNAGFWVTKEYRAMQDEDPKRG
jgi:ATP synthase protein I